MTLRRYKDILALRDGDTILGFHARNLELATLDEAAWDALAAGSTGPAREELAGWEQYNNPEIKNEINGFGVRSLVINITQFCNLRCTYCAAGGDGTYGSNDGAKGKVDLTVAQAQLKKFIGETPDGDSFAVQFFGGEPLLHPEAVRSLANYAKLLTAGRDINLKFSITTNGTMITPAVAQLLADMNCNITLSLDGPAEINDRVRPSAGGKGSTQKVLEGLRNALEVRHRLSGIGINCVVGSHNLDLVAAYEFFKPYDFDFINFIYAVGSADQELSRKFVAQMEDVMKRADAHGGERELRKFPTVDRDFNTLDQGVRTVNHCGAGKSLMYTDTKGAMYTCNWFMDDKTEQVGQNTTLFPSKLADYEGDLVDRHDCHSCWARFLCGGGCMFVNKVKMGDKHVSDPHYCLRTRSLALTMLKYYAKYRYAEAAPAESA